MKHLKLSTLLLAGIIAFSGGIISCKKEQGCMDSKATNYSADAEEDDGSCTFATTTTTGTTTVTDTTTTGGTTTTTTDTTTTVTDTTTTVTDTTTTVVDTTTTTTGPSPLTYGTFSIDGKVYTKKGGNNTSTGKDSDGTGRTKSYYQTDVGAYVYIIYGNRSSTKGIYKINATEDMGTNLASDEVYIAVKGSDGTMHIPQSGTLEIGTWAETFGTYTFDITSFVFTDLPTATGKVSGYIGL